MTAQSHRQEQYITMQNNPRQYRAIQDNAEQYNIV